MAQASEMVEILRTALESNAGVARVVIDGTQIDYNREQLITELQFWERRLSRERRTKPLFRGFDLSSAGGTGITIW